MPWGKWQGLIPSFDPTTLPSTYWIRSILALWGAYICHLFFYRYYSVATAMVVNQSKAVLQKWKRKPISRDKVCHERRLRNGEIARDHKGSIYNKEFIFLASIFLLYVNCLFIYLSMLWYNLWLCFPLNSVLQ